MNTPVLTVVAFVTLIAVPAFAQTEAYESPGYATPNTPAYTPSAPTALDPDFGLPTFGIPGANLPQQRTLATEAAPPPDAGRPPVDFTPTKTPAAGSGDTTGSLTAETPVYTTSETGTTGSDTMPDTE